jgi:hypothetical protein
MNPAPKAGAALDSDSPSSNGDPVGKGTGATGRKWTPGPKPGPGSAVWWRKWNRIVHRDLGYLCAGLTVVYAVSGVAVNHVRDWNPNFSITHDTIQVPVVTGTAIPTGYDVEVLAAAGIVESPRGTFRPDPGTLRVFIEDGVVEVDLANGRGVVERVRERALLREANFLHLNQPRALWTWVADLFAVALAVLAVSGLFMIRGRKGITGRGAWLTAAGVLVPLVFLALYL